MVQVTLLVRDFGTVRFTYFELTSALAAAVAAGAILFRSEWRTRLAGTGLGAWAAIAFAPFFLFTRGPSTAVGWLILAGIAGMIAAQRFEGRLISGRDRRGLARGAAVGFAAVLALEVALTLIAVFISSVSI